MGLHLGIVLTDPFFCGCTSPHEYLRMLQGTQFWLSFVLSHVASSKLVSAFSAFVAALGNVPCSSVVRATVSQRKGINFMRAAGFTSASFVAVLDFSTTAHNFVARRHGLDSVRGTDLICAWHVY